MSRKHRNRRIKTQGEAGTGQDDVQGNAFPETVNAKVSGKVIVSVEPKPDEAENEKKRVKQTAELISKVSELIDKLSAQDKFNSRMVKANVGLAVFAFLGLVVAGYQILKNWESGKLENRAYVTISFVTHSTRLGDSHLRLRWLLKNTGNTPAYDTRLIAISSPDPLNYDTFDTAKVFATIGNPIGGGGQQDTANHDLQINDGRMGNVEEIFNHKIPLYVGIKIEYKDVFGETHFSYRNAEVWLGRERCDFYYHRAPTDN